MKILHTCRSCPVLSTHIIICIPIDLIGYEYDCLKLNFVVPQEEEDDKMLNFGTGWTQPNIKTT